MKKIIIWLPMIVICTLIMAIAIGSLFQVENINANKQGIQIEFKDGTGYWIEK